MKIPFKKFQITSIIIMIDISEKLTPIFLSLYALLTLKLEGKKKQPSVGILIASHSYSLN